MNSEYSGITIKRYWDKSFRTILIYQMKRRPNVSNFFEGWYFKQRGHDCAIALIPALHSDKNGTLSSLQIVSNEETHNVIFSKEMLLYKRKEPRIKLGKSLFSSEGVHVDVSTKDVELFGNLHFGPFLRPHYDIMGPYHYLPFMMCRHSIFSMSHTVCGELTLNGNKMDFDGGNGYIEGDRGHSFPTRYLWTQCGFDDGSLMLSVADIPFLGRCFTGVICIIIIGGREYRLATYLGASVFFIGKGIAVVRQGKYTLMVQQISEACNLLAAPVYGSMSRIIRESLSCSAYYFFSNDNEILLDFVSEHASFESEYT